jgi:hypothetical protein
MPAYGGKVHDVSPMLHEKTTMTAAAFDFVLLGKIYAP